MELPGRGASVEQLTSRVGRAAAGLQVLVVAAPAGMGRTEVAGAVVERAAAQDPALDVRLASGDVDETGVAFGVLDQLAATSAAARSTLPTATTTATTATVPAGSSGAVERGAELVTWLGAEDAPRRLLVVDDVQWADRPSLAALTFALRRLRPCPVAVLLLTRDLDVLPAGLARLAHGPTGCTVTLDGLDVEAARAAVTRWGARASDHVLDRLVRHTGGNPWHLRLVLASTRGADLRDPSDLPPAALAGVEELVAARVAALPDPARSMVQAAAVLGATSPAALVGAVAQVSDPLGATAAATDAALLRTGSTAGVPTLHLAEPARAAIYHATDPARRAELHRRAAAAVAERAASVRHLLAASDRYDAELARTSAELAAATAARGEWDAAAEWELGVARTAPDPADRASAAGRAAHALVVAGDLVAAEHVLDAAEHVPDAHVALIRGRIAAARGQLDDAAEQLGRAWNGDAGGHVGAAAASHLAAIGFARARGDEAARWATRAIDAGVEGLGLSDVDPSSRLLLSLMLAGRDDEAARIAAGATQRSTAAGATQRSTAAGATQRSTAAGATHRSTATDVRVDGVFGRAVLAALTGDRTGGDEVLAAVAERARREGPLSLWAYVQCWRAAIAFRAGRWDQAIEQAALATIVAENEAWSFVAAAHACVAVVLATQGRVEQAGTSLTAARDASVAAGRPELVRHIVDSAEAWAAILRQDHGRVLELTAPLDDAVAGAPLLAAPPIAMLRGLAASRSGDATTTRRCAQQLVHFSPWSAWSRALSALADGIDGDTDRGVDGLGRAIDDLSPGAFPLDEAMLRFELGAALRRANRRGPAAEQLRLASSLAVGLGASPLAERIDAELAMQGTRRPRRHDAPTALTPTEQVVASLAAEGRSNREIAAELVVSVKTVEFHLSNVFRKLGVTNRTRLARRSPG